MTEFTPNTAALLAPALAHSRYLARIFTRRPEMAEETATLIEQPFLRAEMLARLPDGLQSDDEFKIALRQLRQAVMARLIARELSGRCSLQEAVATVSDLAEVSVETALRQVSQADPRYGLPIGEESGEKQELIVVGLGKLGLR